MKDPNFFIIGAPKCGTTSLSRYLGDHDQVFMTEPKEPHYFNRRLITMPSFRDVPSYRNSWEHYRQLYEAATDQHLAVGEASTRYLLHDETLEEINSKFPEAKILVMFRKPVEMVYAAYYEQLYQSTEVVTDFEQAWDLQWERMEGRNIPPSSGTADMLFYGPLGKMGEHLDRTWRIFGKDRVQVIFYEDFRDQTRRVYREVLEFLGVPDDGRDDFPVFNSSKRSRFPKLIGALKGARGVRLASAKVKHVLGVSDWGFFSTLHKLTRSHEKRPPLSPEMHNRMIDYYEEDIRKLESLTGRDLASWRQRKAAEPTTPPSEPAPAAS